MFENITKFFKNWKKKENKNDNSSRDTAKERLHLVLMQDRANVSADFLELMKQEIIEVIKKYIDVDESAIDVRLTNKENSDGTNGAPALYANIPILNIKNEARKVKAKQENKEESKQENKKENKQDNKKENKKENVNNKEKNIKQKEIEEKKEEEAEAKVEQAEIIIEEVNAEKEENKQEKVKKENKDDKENKENKEEQEDVETKEKVKSENN